MVIIFFLTSMISVGEAWSRTSGYITPSSKFSSHRGSGTQNVIALLATETMVRQSEP